MRLVKQLGAVLAVALVGSQAVLAADGNAALTLVLGIVTAVLIVIVYRWVVRRTEHREPVEAEFRGPALARGVLIGVAVFSTVMLNIAVNDGYQLHGWGSATGLVEVFGFTVAAVTTEELIFRGVLFRVAEEQFGTWLALTLTAVLFGLMHLANPNATGWSTITIAVAGGGMLTSAYAATRTLWVPIGLHFGWNFAEAGIFGTAVSGKSAPEGLLDGVTSGSTWLTGGEFGPEASLSALGAGVVVTAVFLLLARRRGRLVPRRSAAAGSVATLTQ